jgi:hypothetical protein
VVPLLQRLLDLLNDLRPGPRTASTALRDLLRALAAEAIQADPAASSLPPGDWPAEIVDAIQEGDTRAAALNSERVLLHVEGEELPLSTPAGWVTDAPSASIGPFVDRNGRLVRFTEHLSPTLLPVVVRIPGDVLEHTALMIPRDSKPEERDDQIWVLPRGTVWMWSGYMALAAQGFTGLRISGGRLHFTGSVIREEERIVLTDHLPWSLAVAPEPAASEPTGSDAHAVTVSLPERLTVHAEGPPEVLGGASLSGFGSNLTLTRSTEPAFATGQLVCLPLAASEGLWTIDGNRSTAAQFSGKAQVESPVWAFPQTASLSDISRAPHGGSLVMRLSGQIDSRFAGQGGAPFKWFVSTLTANGQRLQLEGLQVLPGGRDDVEVWSKSRSSFTFSQQAIQRLYFRSERDGDDAVAILGGLQRNFWDAPRRSDGQRFGFEGRIDVIGLIASASGFVLSSRASADRTDERVGLALENLYVVVGAPRRCAMVCAFVPEENAAPDGLALLFFDSRLSLFTLPDPYATNVSIPLQDPWIDDSIRVSLKWAISAPPAVTVHLNRPLGIERPEPPHDVDEDEGRVHGTFREFLGAARDRVFLLDLSTREHLFGVALDLRDDQDQSIADNRFTTPLHRVRLFLQPQVHWERVWVQKPVDPPLTEGLADSRWNGGPTLLGANSPVVVPTLPARVSGTLLDAIRARHRAAALFSLPFGLRAMVRLSPDDDLFERQPPAVDTRFNEPDFGAAKSALQIRLTARNLRPAGAIEDPARAMPGIVRQLKNLSSGESVLSGVRGGFNTEFGDTVPLHHVDLSGYGLSTFSEWRREAQSGVTKVQFHVLNGRTAYEVIQLRSVLYECGAPVVRTITIERHNSAAMILSDTGWVAAGDGVFGEPQHAFETGAVVAFRNIRRIRIIGSPFRIASHIDIDVQPVIFDANVEIRRVESDGARATVQMFDRPGYVQVRPLAPLLTREQLQALFTNVGPITSGVDCRVRIGDTLALECTAITSDTAVDDASDIGFAVAVVGRPKLPRAGQWTAVKIDPVTSEVVPLDPRRGVPVVRKGAQPYVFREPSDARRTTANVRYGLLMSTQASRVLFPQPRIDSAPSRKIAFDPPSLADPYSLVQSTAIFPRPAFALRLTEAPVFDVLGDHLWKIQNPQFTFASPNPDVLKGGEWAIARDYGEAAGRSLTLDINSVLPGPWKVAMPPSTLDVVLPMLPPGLQQIFRIRTHYQAESGGLPRLATPTLEFTGALNDVKKVVDSLKELADLVDFPFDVNVVGGSGASPSFLVQMQLMLRIGRPGNRVDIGVGKFFGQFLVQGNLEVATTGVNRPRLLLEFQGDIQQGIIPPLLYAGGLFRFAITIPENGRPVVELTMGVVASIGGDLIPGLVEVEVTVKYGYTLIPETLQPGVLLGLEARAKLLAGLIGFSFAVEAMARIERLNRDGVKIWARIRVAATVQVAIFIEEEVDFETQFEQLIPLEAASLIPGVGLLPALAKA